MVRRNYKYNGMVFPSLEICVLLKDLDKTLTPLFENKTSSPNKKFRENEKHYFKILMKLTYIIEEIEKLDPFDMTIKDRNMEERPLPHIFFIIDELLDVLRSCPYDEDGTRDMQDVSYTDGYLYDLTGRLLNRANTDAHLYYVDEEDTDVDKLLELARCLGDLF